MSEYHGTKDVAKILGVKPDYLSRAVWLQRFDPPAKSPSGDYLWTKADIERASWVLNHRAYMPQKENAKER
jgi:hypothetical protein